MANRVAQPRNMSLEIWLTQDRQLDGVTVNVTTHFSQGLSRKIDVRYKRAVQELIPFYYKVTDVGAGVTIENKAIKLSAEDDFMFYGVNKEYFTADAFLGIPSRALGTRYVANCHWPAFYNCEFAFTPTEDMTTVRVTLPRKFTLNIGSWVVEPGVSKPCGVLYLGKMYTNGETFEVTLNQFQVAQIQDPCDLTGALIESDKPIAVWSGDSRTNIGDSPSRDHQVEELFSVDTWGTDCLAWPTPNRAPGLVDYWVVTAAEDGTRIAAYSNELITRYFDLDAGESVRLPANSVEELARFHSDKKFQAVKYASSAVDNTIPGDPAMTVCIPSDQFGFGYTFVTPTGVASTYTNYLSIVTAAGNERGFILNGQPIVQANWKQFPNSDQITTYILLDETIQEFRIEHELQGTRFEAYIYGSGDRESFAYPTGACIQALGQCYPSTMFMADGKDNDCDGVVDEELCDRLDNDFDGQVDEDCYRKQEASTIGQDRCLAVKSSQVCFGNTMTISCEGSEGVIVIIDGHFGRIDRPDETSCSSESILNNCGGESYQCGFENIEPTLHAVCDGQRSCSVPVNYHSFANLNFPRRCNACMMYAHVQYACLNVKEKEFSSFTVSDLSASSWHGNRGVGEGHEECSMQRELDDAYHPRNANFAADSVEGWRPDRKDLASSWLQLDLGGQFHIGWYAISGCRRKDQWVTEFGISYSSDGEQWTVVKADNGDFKHFVGNNEAVKVHLCTIFQENIQARWVRIHPLQYNDFPCLHINFGHSVAVQGCVHEISIPNSNFAGGGTVGYGLTATVRCDRGWMTQNREMSYSVKCETNGQWSNSFQYCNRILTCPGWFLFFNYSFISIKFIRFTKYERRLCNFFKHLCWFFSQICLFTWLPALW